MIVFAGLMTLLLMVAGGWLLYPMMRHGIALRLQVSVVLLILVGALGMYGLMGNPKVLSRHNAPVAQSAEMTGLIEQLSQRLAREPNDVDGWLLLANSYVLNQQPEKALAAFEQAHHLQPDDVGVLLSMVDVQVTLDQGLITKKVDHWLLQVLQHEPDNSLALWFAGLSAQQKGNSQQAAELFRKMKQSLPKDAPVSQRIIEQLNQLTNQ
jgi:cytochrome c-type biogenesis protein CcmH